jgi:hypothetical protein
MCGGGPSAPPPPAAPPPAPTLQDVSAGRARADAAARARVQRGVGGSVRNEGGAQGLGLVDTQRALKTLTGQ